MTLTLKFPIKRLTIIEFMVDPIILTLEQEVGVLEAETQLGSDMLDGHGCSVGEFCILFQFVLDDGNSLVHWYRCK